MACCNNEWWKADLDLSKDIHDVLKMKEGKMCVIKQASPLFHFRRFVTDWVTLLCQHFGLHASTQHLAVYLYDRYTDVYSVPYSQVQALMMTCFLIASKYEEMEDNIPKFATLLKVAQWDINASDYLCMELRVLSAFKWDIGFPTAPHFRDFYMQEALSGNDLYEGRLLANRNEAYVCVEKNVDYFLEISVLEPKFLEHKPSLIMAACLAAARFRVRITPTWTAELLQKTEYSFTQLRSCFELLLRSHAEGPHARFAVLSSGAGIPLGVPPVLPIASYSSIVGHCAMQYTTVKHTAVDSYGQCDQACSAKKT